MNYFDFKTANRFLVAAKSLLTGPLDPEFAGDHASVMFLSGPRLGLQASEALTKVSGNHGMDVVYAAFDDRNPSRGPERIHVFAERHGVVFRWDQCALWAPADGGPLQIVSAAVGLGSALGASGAPAGRGPLQIATLGETAISFDGLALTWGKTPAHALGEGMARAKTRLRHAAALVTNEEVEQLTYILPVTHAA